MKLSIWGIEPGADVRQRGHWWRIHWTRRTGLVRRLAITAAVGLGAFSAGISPARAAASELASTPAPSSSPYQFSAEPYAASGAQQRPDFAYELQPGHAILDQLVVLNNTTTAESFLIYGEDAISVANSEGFAFQTRARMHNTTVGTWVTVGATTLNVPPGKEVVDTFRLAVPVNAPPGDHVGAVVAEEVKGPVQQKRPTGLNVVLRIATPVYVHVVGKSLPQLTTENVTVYHQSPAIPYVFGAAKVAVRFDLVNTGNDILDPKSVTVSITGLLDGTIHTYTVRRSNAAQSRANPLPAQILPGGKASLTEEWSGIPPFDPLTAHVSGIAIDASTLQKVSTATSTPFWYFPWIAVLILLAIIAGVIFVIRRRRRAKAGGAPASDDGESGSGGPHPPASSMSDDEILEEAGT